MTRSAQPTQTAGARAQPDELAGPRYPTVRLVAGITPLPYPLQPGQTGLLIRRLGVNRLHNVDMAGVLFGTQYYQIALDSLENLVAGQPEQPNAAGQ